MLPELDTPERAHLEREALTAGREALSAEHGSLPNALYRVYMTFRERFLSQRGLHGAQQERSDEWLEALIDARQLEAFVNDAWVSLITRC
jgi:hypothetical protein